jgi:hypothetical protein
MPWNRNDPDPLEARRRQLAEQERLLAEQRKRLTEELLHSDDPAEHKRAEPPVWRMEDDVPHPRITEPSATRKRHLARQRQRDMFLFFIFGLVFIVVVIVLLVVHSHNATPIGGT